MQSAGATGLAGRRCWVSEPSSPAAAPVAAREVGEVRYESSPRPVAGGLQHSLYRHHLRAEAAIMAHYQAADARWVVVAADIAYHIMSCHVTERRRFGEGSQNSAGAVGGRRTRSHVR